MNPPPIEPASGLTGEALLAYYAAAKRAGKPIYDESWVVPNNSYFTWKKGKPHGRCARTWGGTLFERLVKLGVLEKVEGPLFVDLGATPVEQLKLPLTTRDGRNCEL